MPVVEHAGPTMHARIGAMRALNRGHVREFRASKLDPHRGQRLKRDEWERERARPGYVWGFFFRWPDFRKLTPT